MNRKRLLNKGERNRCFQYIPEILSKFFYLLEFVVKFLSIEKKMKITRTGFIAVILFLLVPGSGIAHDIWMVGEPGLFLLQPGPITLKATVGGNFPEYELAITTDRIAESYLIDPDWNKKKLDWKVREKWSEAFIQIPGSGHFHAVLVQAARYIELTADQFNQYIEHEGLSQIKKLREQMGIQNQQGREIYSRYVKALIHVDGQHMGWKIRPLGLKVEIVPKTHPCAGGTVPVQFLFEGQPLKRQTFLYGTEGMEFREARTNDRGEAVLEIDRSGVWFVKTIHMIYREKPQRLADHEAEWSSYWATLTFEVPRAR